ncbi:MAG: hypothetical protein NTY08_08825 [Proteobacteria bacterium]|nr:hypothetical protein [Pseudomonadota bacterium]
MVLKPTSCIAIVSSLGLSLGLFACSSEQINKPNASSSFASSDKNLSPNSGKSTAKRKLAAADGVDETQDPDDQAGDPQLDDGTAEVAAIIKSCGFPDGTLPDPKEIVFKKSMRSQQVTIKGTKPIDPSMVPPPPPIPIIGGIIGGITNRIVAILPPANYTAVVRATVNVAGSMSGATQSVRVGLEAFNVTVPGVSIPADAGRADAEREVAANNSDSSSAGPSEDEQSNLSSAPGPWKSVLCTITPTKTLTFSKGGKSKTVQFDTPIPGAIWAKATAARFKTEIGDGKTFDNITATVTSSNDAALPQGTKVKGRVTVTPISGDLPEIGVKADVAYAIRTDFGAQTVNLGLNPTQSFYVSTSNQDLRAVVIETGDAKIPRLVVAAGQ